MRLYDWTPDQIASMTPFQQLYAAGIDPDEGTMGTVQFDTMEDYIKWAKTRSQLT